MGGFTVNGCGVGDSFNPIHILGNHYCKCCNSIQEYGLMEVKRKIKVFYIPTVSINKKYAVACKKCKNGYYIEDSVRDDLVYGRKKIRVDEESGEIYCVNAAGYVLEQPEPESSQNEEPMTDKDSSALDKAAGICPACGTGLRSEQVFCTACGMRIK